MKTLALASALLASAVTAEVPPDVDWRRVATAADRAKLRGWRIAWVDALAKVRTGGGAATLAADPALFDPDAARLDADLAIGHYRCRLTRLGGAPAVIVREPTRCMVDRDGPARTMVVEGVQRIVGNLFDDTDARLVFLGTAMLPDERKPMRYGRDARRDIAGLVKRIGDRRWRLVLYRPAFSDTLDVIEVTPDP